MCTGMCQRDGLKQRPVGRREMLSTSAVHRQMMTILQHQLLRAQYVEMA